MAERTLNYYKEYTILNPDGSVKEKFPDFKEIKAPAECDYELYGALVEGDDSECRWALLDGNGDYVTLAKYVDIGDRILDEDGVYVIFVDYENDLCNLITPDGKEIFAENYNSITCLKREICILCKDSKYGLGNIKTGEVILDPRYGFMRETNNEDLFLVYDDYHMPYRWGLVSSGGKELFAINFVNFVDYYNWQDFNIACSIIETENGRNYNLSEYSIIGWHGNKIYEASAQTCERLKLDQSIKKAVNAFIFFAEGSKYKKGEAKVVVFDYSETENMLYAYEQEFRYRNERAHDVGCRILRKKRLMDLVY